MHRDNSPCPQVLPWQPFVMNLWRTGKVRRLAYLAGYFSDLVQICFEGGIFGF